ncbi:FAD-dependent oxidoreductase, partial [Erwinia amylovora]|uniref:FAD-dependent oxidoreductase n=1 Tax=Erwinia amylovora TaxID=552 RepID=UPI0020BDF307
VVIGFDEVVLATGIVPRTPDSPGIGHPSVLSYLDVIGDKKPRGQRVAIIGAGGVGFETAEYLAVSGPSPSLDLSRLCQEWGIDRSLKQ